MNYLALFMKSPESGTAKRRLRSVLSEEAIARLCEAFVGDLLDKLTLLPCDRKVIAYAGETPAFHRFQGASHFSLYAQSGKDLGERLQNYFQWSFAQGATKSVVIGSDSPTLPIAYLEQALDLLDRHETVLGPSEDGGYYLIGMRRFTPEAFQRIPWGTGRVLGETLKRLHPEDRVGLLNRWYDVDTPMDLKRLRDDPNLPTRTHRVLSGLVF